MKIHKIGSCSAGQEKLINLENQGYIGSLKTYEIISKKLQRVFVK